MSRFEQARRIWKWWHRRHDLFLVYDDQGARFICRHGHELRAIDSETRVVA